MKVILKQDVKKLGSKGDVAEVSSGYARNFLIPRDLAEEASSGNVKELKKMQQSQEKRFQKEIERAQKLSEKLSSGPVVVKTKAGDNGKLFGSVTSKDVADAIKDQLNIKIDKRKIDFSEPIKALGNYTFKVKVHPEVHGKVTVEVIAE